MNPTAQMFLGAGLIGAGIAGLATAVITVGVALLQPAEIPADGPSAWMVELRGGISPSVEVIQDFDTMADCQAAIRAGHEPAAGTFRVACIPLY